MFKLLKHYNLALSKIKLNLNGLIKSNTNLPNIDKLTIYITEN